MHYAAHDHTAAEVIYGRAAAEQPFMGLRTFSSDFPTKKDIGVEKNYLDEKEFNWRETTGGSRKCEPCKGK